MLQRIDTKAGCTEAATLAKAYRLILSWDDFNASSEQIGSLLAPVKETAPFVVGGEGGATQPEITPSVMPESGNNRYGMENGE